MLHLRHNTETTIFVVLKALANLSASRGGSIGLKKDRTQCPSGWRRKMLVSTSVLTDHGELHGTTPNHRPRSVGPNRSTRPAAQATPKRRRNRVQVDGLYLEREPEIVRHARALLELIQEQCPEKVGRYIPHTHLDRTYRELCEREGWKARTWAAIARRLGRITRKRLVKRDGSRFIAYRIPAPY